MAGSIARFCENMRKACQETTRECPQCHEEHVPVASAKGPICPSCGHRYNS